MRWPVSGLPSLSSIQQSKTVVVVAWALDPDKFKLYVLFYVTQTSLDCNNLSPIIIRTYFCGNDESIQFFRSKWFHGHFHLLYQW